MHRSFITPLSWFVALAVATAVAGCLRKSTYAACQSDPDCSAGGATGHCEANHRCSVDDQACPGGRRYDPSAGDLGGTCVGDQGPDAATADTPAAPTDAQSAVGLECIKGGKRAAAPGCSADVCAAEPRCCSEQWNAVCVRLAETVCKKQCSTMAFVGDGGDGAVIDTATWKVIWPADPTTSSDAFTWGGYWADYDGDGREDLATVGNTLLRIYHNEGYDGFALNLHETYSKTWSSLPGATGDLGGRTGAWADVDGDGKLDVVLGGSDGLVLIHNLGGGVFGNEQVLLQAPPLADKDAQLDEPQVLSVGFADADGDGDVDLAVGSWTHPSSYFENDGHGTLTRTAWQGTTGAEGTEWCNVGGGALPELITSGYAFVDAFGPVAAGMPGNVVHVATSTYFVETRCGDLDGDGDLDLFSNAWHEPSQAFRNAGPSINAFSKAWSDPSATLYYTHGVDLGDLDGDGKLDAVSSGNDFNEPFTIRWFKNTSTNMQQNIGFAAQPVPSVTVKGAPMPGHSIDVELGSLPPITP